MTPPDTAAADLSADVTVPAVVLMRAMQRHLWLGPFIQPEEARYCRICTEVEPPPPSRAALGMGRLVAVKWPCPTYAELAGMPGMAPYVKVLEQHYQNRDIFESRSPGDAN